MESTQCVSTKQSDYISIGWDSVGWACLFVVFNILLSIILKLKMEISLIIASLRCVAQLTLMAYILEPVLVSTQPWVPFIMGAVFVILASYETVFHQSKVRHRYMILTCFFAILISNGIVGILGLSFIIKVVPFWAPQQFVPIIGMLLGNSMSGMAIGISDCLTHLSSHKDAIEMHLSYGATRWETSKPIAVKSIQIGMIPTINSMCIMGIISIPGMMTGQILGGANVMDAVRYQQVIMFMLLSSTALGILIAVIGALWICIDDRNRHRMERIFMGPAWQERLYEKYIVQPFFRWIDRLKIFYSNQQVNGVQRKDIGLSEKSN